MYPYVHTYLVASKDCFNKYLWKAPVIPIHFTLKKVKLLFTAKISVKIELSFDKLILKIAITKANMIFTVGKYISQDHFLSRGNFKRTKVTNSKLYFLYLHFLSASYENFANLVSWLLGIKQAYILGATTFKIVCLRSLIAG